MEFKNPTEVLKKIFHHSRLDTVVPGTLTVSCYANFFPICYMNDNSEYLPKRFNKTTSSIYLYVCNFNKNE